jgi:hypothetical protein
MGPALPLRVARRGGTGLLIDCGGWLHRDDFTSRFVTTGTSISDGVTLLASTDWEAAVTALHAGELPSSGGKRRMLLLAASIAGGTPVSLYDTLTGMDHRNASPVIHSHRARSITLHVGQPGRFGRAYEKTARPDRRRKVRPGVASLPAMRGQPTNRVKTAEPRSHKAPIGRWATTPSRPAILADNAHVGTGEDNGLPALADGLRRCPPSTLPPVHREPDRPRPDPSD